ncbi:MAG: acyl-CoA dehydrogenase family protein [Acidimicrobiia bacterium]|nr:MAG: acyl-CoA dehydrogenase family protein [Acidimicrobiia bacterium]
MAESISFARTEEQAMLGATVREFLEATVDMDSTRDSSLTDSAINRDAWSGLVEMGLIGLHIPEEYGGAGYSFVETAIVFEELGRRVVPVPLLSSTLASSAILSAGSEDQKARLLPQIASGERIATLAAFEDAHDLERCETKAEPDGNGWRLSGLKRYVTDAPNADAFVVIADTGAGTGLFMVDGSAAGVSVNPTPSLDATRPLGELELQNVAVDTGAYLGGSPSEHALRAALDAGVVALAQEQAAGTQRCLEISVEYAKSRFQFGRAIGSFQAVKHMCADMLVAVEHARSAASHAARTLDDPHESGVAVPLAKSVCSDAYLKAAGDTIQIFGGIGFTWEHDAHLYLKRAKSTALLLGSVESYRDRLADAIGI